MQSCQNFKIIVYIRSYKQLVTHYSWLKHQSSKLCTLKCLYVHISLTVTIPIQSLFRASSYQLCICIYVRYFHTSCEWIRYTVILRIAARIYYGYFIITQGYNMCESLHNYIDQYGSYNNNPYIQLVICMCGAPLKITSLVTLCQVSKFIVSSSSRMGFDIPLPQL